MPTIAALDRFVLHELNVKKGFEDHEPLQGSYPQRRNDRNDNSKNPGHQKARTYAIAAASTM